MNCNNTNKIAVIEIITKYGVGSNSPFSPTKGEITPPRINWNNPNKLEALPLPPVLSSIANAKPKGPIDVTGLIFKKNAMISNQIGKCIDNVIIISITPII